MLYFIEPAWNNGKQPYVKCRNVVVFGTYNRAHLMRQSMYAYEQSLDTDWDAVVVLDDGSTDDTLEVCAQYSNLLDVYYFKLEDKAPGVWRDSALF